MHMATLRSPASTVPEGPAPCAQTATGMAKAQASSDESVFFMGFDTMPVMRCVHEADSRAL